MSARKAKRPDLAIAEVRTHWVPNVGERVRRADQTTLAQITYGTADVLGISRDGRLVTVARDPGPYGEPRWVKWPVSQVRRATSAKTTPTAAPTADPPHADRTEA